MNDHSFGSPKNLLLAGAVLAVIILLNRQRNPYLRVASLVIAMAVGYLLAWAMDMLPADAPAAPGGDHYSHAALLRPGLRLELAAAADADLYGHLAGNHRRHHRHL